MNERIQKLLDQVEIPCFDGMYAPVYAAELEKFAELIVLETINCAAHIEGIEAIKQHFGIKT